MQSGVIIKSAKLTNFKCHSNFQEDLKNITILAGENAAGKSSLIQSILVFDEGLRKDYVFTLNVHDINLGQASNLISESSGSDSAEIELEVNDIACKYTYSLLADDRVNLKVNTTLTDAPDFNLFYLNAERVGPRVYNEIISAGELYVGTHGENTAYVLNRIEQLIKTEYKNSAGIELLKTFAGDSTNFRAVCEHCLREVIPGVKLSSKADPETGTSYVRYATSDNQAVVPTATGFGLTYVLPIIVQGLASLLAEAAVFIVENPEAHLHPYSQSKIGRFLARIAASGKQVIIETHSEHVINGCRLELAAIGKNDIAKIMFFQREDGHEEPVHTVISIDEVGELSSWPEGFFDQNEKDLMEVLKNKISKKR